MPEVKKFPLKFVALVAKQSKNMAKQNNKQTVKDTAKTIECHWHGKVAGK